MIELQRSPSHQALASDGSNAYQSTRQGASRMLGVEKPPSRVFVFRVFASERLRTIPWRWIARLRNANENGNSYSRAAATKTQPRTVIGFVSASGGARRSIFVLFLPTASAPRMSQRFARVRCHRRLSIDR